MSALDILAWNVKNNRQPDVVGAHLRQLLAQTGPMLAGLYEGRQYDKVIDRVAREMGYAAVQLDPQRLTEAQRKRKVQEERANVAVLIRRDLIDAAGARPVVKPWFMHEQFTGAKAGLPHLPRVYLRLGITIDGERWRTGFAHWPTEHGNRAAVAETYRRTSVFLRNATHDGHPAVVVGDLNQPVPGLALRFPTVVKGKHVDHLLGSPMVKGEARVLGRHGSDHNAILYHVRSKAAR